MTIIPSVPNGLSKSDAVDEGVAAAERYLEDLQTSENASEVRRNTIAEVEKRVREANRRSQALRVPPVKPTSAVKAEAYEIAVLFYEAFVSHLQSVGPVHPLRKHVVTEVGLRKRLLSLLPRSKYQPLALPFLALVGTIMFLMLVPKFGFTASLLLASVAGRLADQKWVNESKWWGSLLWGVVPCALLIGGSDQGWGWGAIVCHILFWKDPRGGLLFRGNGGSPVVADEHSHAGEHQDSDEDLPEGD